MVSTQNFPVILTFLHIEDEVLNNRALNAKNRFIRKLSHWDNVVLLFAVQIVVKS